MRKFVINSDFYMFKQAFLNENLKINLISKNDEKFLFEKHFYDSLAVKLFFEKYDYTPNTILDIGTGGGFPAVPIAMEYPDINVAAIDSIGKKIRAVKNISDTLNLRNVFLINDRVENIKDTRFDLIVSRAVSKVGKMIEYGYPLLNDNGYIVLYKSILANEEITEAKNIIRKYKLKILPQIEYSLPLDENYNRTLVIFKK